MRHLITSLVLAAAATLVLAGSAAAWHLEGNVYCDGTGQPLAGVEIVVAANDGGDPYSMSSLTDEDGHYLVELLDSPRCYRATITLGQSEFAVNPVSGYYDFCTTDEVFEITRDWVIGSPSCSASRCWLTGGGAKFSQLTDTYLATAKKKHNFGGNVNPGCSSTAGQGGQWNDIVEDQQLHFQGIAMHVERCGNVDGIPFGSTSPETPFNFIEFAGTGRLKGIKGNKVDYGTVNFWARCEDRNEPGSNGQRDGSGKDRYFLNVYSGADMITGNLVLVDEDGDPATVDPLIITDGNLQIHVSSCDVPLPVTIRSGGLPPVSRLTPSGAGTEAPTSLWFAAPRPTPAQVNTVLKFAIPHESDVSLMVYDVMGRSVRELAAGRVAAGQHAISWDLRDESGQRVGRGMYFLRLRVDGDVLTQRVTVMD